MNYLLDTNAVIFLLGKKSVLDVVGRFGVSIITEIELFSHPSLSAEEERSIIKFLNMMERFPLDDKIRDRTIQIRRSTHIKLPDAVIAATSLEWNAILVTNDKRFSLVPNLGIHALI